MFYPANRLCSAHTACQAAQLLDSPHSGSQARPFCRRAEGSGGGLPRGGSLGGVLCVLPPAVDTPQPGVGGASVTPARRAVAGGLRRGLPAPGRQGFTCSASPRQRSDGRLFAGPVPAPGVGDAATQPEVHAADSLQTVHCFHLKRLKDFSKHCWGVCVRSQFVHGVMFKGRS